jgi:hypothetical protein
MAILIGHPGLTFPTSLLWTMLHPGELQPKLQPSDLYQWSRRPALSLVTVRQTGISQLYTCANIVLWQQVSSQQGDISQNMLTWTIFQRVSLSSGGGYWYASPTEKSAAGRKG